MSNGARRRIARGKGGIDDSVPVAELGSLLDQILCVLGPLVRRLWRGLVGERPGGRGLDLRLLGDFGAHTSQSMGPLILVRKPSALVFVSPCASQLV